MSTAQHLLLSHRAQLLEWIGANPTPLLRGLADAGLLTRDQYCTLLERQPPVNRAANALEQACGHEESSREFLHVLRKVSGYYCPQLSIWLQKNQEDTQTHTHIIHTPTEKKKKKNKLSLFKGKSSSKDLMVAGQDGVDGLKLRPNLRSAAIRVALSTHRHTVLQQTERLVSYAEGERHDSSSHAHIDIRYTELFVTEDDDLEAEAQHETFTFARQQRPLFHHQACMLIQPGELLNHQPKTGHRPKRVKVKGIAGIGKSVAMQRLLYEWALGKAMQDFCCVFDLRFRELSLIDKPVSLRQLLTSRFVYLQDILDELFIHCASSLLFVLDGLDEFRHQMNWDVNDRDLSVDTSLPISELLVALIKGNFLPESWVIVTTRPSTDPPKHLFKRCCIVLGFQEKHVEEYIMKFYKDSLVAKKVFDYVSKNDSLFGLSFIPLYCYIICSALAEFFTADKENDGETLDLNPPRTVSEVYYCYLYTTIKHHTLKNQPETNLGRGQVLSLVRQQLLVLGRFAYENLLRNQILFDRKELEESGLHPNGVQSTFLNQILVPLKEEQMFAFFHLTVQEYLAALFCVVSLDSHDEVLTGLDYWCFGEMRPPATCPPLTCPGDWIKLPQVEKLQMFTRFFAGLVRTRLDGLLGGMAPNVFTVDKGGETFPVLLGEWFKSQFKNRTLNRQTVLNLLHCLMELHTQEATSRVALEISKLNLFKMKLTLVDCAAMHYVLQFSNHRLDELNVGYSSIGNRGFSRLHPILHRCESLYIRYNCLGTDAAILESVVLRSEDCQVKKLFMCGNKLGSEGAQALWTALQHNHTVEEVYLDITGITEEGTDNIVECLRNNNTLKLLTLVGNDLGESGWARLRELSKLRPDLRIIGHFAEDEGLLQAYLNWVEEMRSDREQMDSVKNADALQSILKDLSISGTNGQNADKAKELEAKILQLLQSNDVLK